MPIEWKPEALEAALDARVPYPLFPEHHDNIRSALDAAVECQGLDKLIWDLQKRIIELEDAQNG